MIISMLKIFALICTALICGKLSAKLKLPAILGWLVAGIVFGPYLAGVVTADITDAMIKKTEQVIESLLRYGARVRFRCHRSPYIY